jgi:hypothetical protein
LRETCATDRQASKPAKGRTVSSHQVHEVANLRRLLYVGNRELRLSRPALPVNRSFFRPKSTFLLKLDVSFALEILLGQDMLLCLEGPPCPCLISPLVRLHLRSYPLERLAWLAPLAQSDSWTQRWPEHLTPTSTSLSSSF